jgi:hypothetical protein
MTTNYEEFISEVSSNKLIKRVNEDGSISFIPMDESNSDYQRYLNPEAEQSTPIMPGDE